MDLPVLTHHVTAIADMFESERQTLLEQWNSYNDEMNEVLSLKAELQAKLGAIEVHEKQVREQNLSLFFRVRQFHVLSRLGPLSMRPVGLMELEIMCKAHSVSIFAANGDCLLEPDSTWRLAIVPHVAVSLLALALVRLFLMDACFEVSGVSGYFTLTPCLTGCALCEKQPLVYNRLPQPVYKVASIDFAGTPPLK